MLSHTLSHSWGVLVRWIGVDGRLDESNKQFIIMLVVSMCPPSPKVISYLSYCFCTSGKREGIKASAEVLHICPPSPKVMSYLPYSFCQTKFTSYYLVVLFLYWLTLFLYCLYALDKWCTPVSSTHFIVNSTDGVHLGWKVWI